MAGCGSDCITVTFVAWSRLGTAGHCAVLRLYAAVGTDDVKMICQKRLSLVLKN